MQLFLILSGILSFTRTSAFIDNAEKLSGLEDTLATFHLCVILRNKRWVTLLLFPEETVFLASVSPQDSRVNSCRL